MIEFAGVWLLRPWWLATLPVLAVAGWLLNRHGNVLGAWNGIIDTALVPVLAHAGFLRLAKKSWGYWQAVLLAGLLGLALAGPAIRTGDANVFRKLNPLLLVMDVSRSMTEGGNFEEAQAAAVHLLQQADARPVGLIVFSNEAYVAGVMTSDPGFHESTIAVLGSFGMPDEGSNPGAALKLAGKMLAETGSLSADVVMISDGGGVDDATLKQAGMLREAGAWVSTVFVEPDIKPYGMQAADIDGLKKIATAGKGVVMASARMDAVSGVLHDDIADMAVAGMAAMLFTDIGRYIVLFAMFPALLLLRRRR